MLIRKLVTLLTVLALGAVGGAFYTKRQSQSAPQINATNMITAVRSVLELAAVEVNLNQVYEFSRDNISVSSIQIPFTKQRSLVGVQGQAKFGFDMTEPNSRIVVTDQEVVVQLPAAKLLTLDLDYRFISEETTFINRMTPQDRTSVLTSIKREVTREMEKSDFALRAERRTGEMLGELGGLLGRPVRYEVAKVE